ncbi:MAG: YicC family protein, partial [Cloacibacillus sp.]|nr:YicC family protein [Cloacibacillus sp.]
KLRKLFRRGKVQMRLEVLWAQSFKTGRVNREVLLSYCSELLELRRGLAMPLDLNVEQVASFPGVLDLPRFDDEEDSQSVEAVFDELLTNAAASWQKMRETEGAHLRDEVLSHLAELERLAALIEERWLPTLDDAFAA